MNAATTTNLTGTDSRLWTSWASLLSFGRGAGSRPARRETAIRIRRQDLCFILTNLATLVENGLSIVKALGTLAKEKSLRKYATLLESLCGDIEAGETLSASLAAYPRVFDSVLVSQIRVAERAGTLAATLERVAGQLERATELRGQVLKKLAYPLVLMVMGTVAVTFMLMFVIPLFQETYSKSKIPLPMITQVLVGASHLASQYGWIIPITISGAFLTIKSLRNHPKFAAKVDRAILRIPIVGDFIRDFSVLRMMEVLSSLLESGFTLVESLKVCLGTIQNQAIREHVESLQLSVSQGERFSRELDLRASLFPPVVSQLVVVGEKTGHLAQCTAGICKHLRKEIERKTNTAVATIEPILTISLAAMIGTILLGIYLPMFDMVGVMSAR